MILLETFISSLPYVCVTVLATLAITLIFKTSDTANFAQGVIAAFSSFIVIDLFNQAAFPLYLGIPLGIIIGFIVGAFIDVVIFRNGKNVNAIGQQIITMGLVSVFYGVTSLLFNKKFINGFSFRGFSDKIIKLGKVNIPVNSLYCLGITLAVIAVIFIGLYFTKWGLGVRATASNEVVADMLGVNTRAITAISWALACGIGTLSAILYATVKVNVNVLFMGNIQVDAFMASILGGFATFYGPVIAAVIVPLFTRLVGLLAIYPRFSFVSGWVNVIVYILILLLILLKPKGLFGKSAVRKV